MNDERDDGLDALERRLLARERVVPTAEARARLVRGIERARLGEKRAWLAACAAALFAALSVRITLPGLDVPSGARPRVVAPSELEALGFDSTEAARMARVLSSASVVRLAPIPSNGASLPSFHVSR